MGPEPVTNPVHTAAANPGPDRVHSSALKNVNDGANAIHKMTRAAVDDLGFNKPSIIKWGKWLVGKLGSFGYVVTIALSPILLPASLAYDAGRGMKLMLRKITRVEEPVQKLLPMVAKQVEDVRKLEQHKQDLKSQNAELSDQLAAWKVHAGELTGLNDQCAHQAQQLGQKLSWEHNRNHELNVLLERVVRRADHLDGENADSRDSYRALRALKVGLDKQLAEKSLRIQQLSGELEAARQQYDQTNEDNTRVRQAQADKIHCLESNLAADQQQMRDMEARYQARVRTLEGQHQFEVNDAEAQHRLEVESLKTLHQDRLQTLTVQNEAQVQALLREISELRELTNAKERKHIDALDSLSNRLSVQADQIRLHEETEQQLRQQISQFPDLQRPDQSTLEDGQKTVAELLETRIAPVKQQIEDRNTEIARLKQQYSESVDQCERLKEQLNKLNERRREDANLEKFARTLQSDEIRKLHNNLKGTEAHVHRLAGEKKALLADQQSQSEALNNRLKKCDEQLQQLMSKSKFDEEEKDKLLGENVRLDHRVGELLQEVSELKGQLEHHQMNVEWYQLYIASREGFRPVEVEVK
ncbi:hypothetical protein [Endozoicomonas sp. SESOKO1]|uniref:hypothetical protein n=1 Tax=Endozoicomonas sp. SESOKO1 TaxID=2828742 RepID=UPI002147A2C3|nr:hypothetical protein [Endozoicomonas sp. SESOKO1]